MTPPDRIQLRKRSRILELDFGAERFDLTAEYLRVYSPSAEVRGHGDDQAVLQAGKLHVGITDVVPQGHYAIRIVFDDGHDTGIYTWDYLYDLGANREARWQAYLSELSEAGKRRDPDESTVRLIDPS